MKRLVLAALLLCPMTLAAQASLTVKGPGTASSTFSLDSLRHLPQAEVRGKIHDGPEVTWKGPLLATVIAASGTPTDRVRGKALRIAVLAEARDGYAVTYSLGELTLALTGRQAILAVEADGKPMDDEAGPLRIIIEGDQYPARWMRQVTSLTLLPLGQQP